MYFNIQGSDKQTGSGSLQVIIILSTQIQDFGWKAITLLSGSFCAAIMSCLMKRRLHKPTNIHFKLYTFTFHNSDKICISDDTYIEIDIWDRWDRYLLILIMIIRGGIEHDHDYHLVVAARSISASKVKVPWSWETVPTLPTVCRHINRSPLLPAPNPPPHIPLVALYIMHGSAPLLLLLSNESESLQGWKGGSRATLQSSSHLLLRTHTTPPSCPSCPTTLDFKRISWMKVHLSHSIFSCYKCVHDSCT